MVRDLHWPGTGTRNVDAKRDDGMTRETRGGTPEAARAAVRGRAGSPGRTTHTWNPVPLARAPQVVLLGSLLTWLADGAARQFRGPHCLGKTRTASLFHLNTAVQPFSH